MQRYKLTVAYDGTDYAGWQWQDNSPTIERALRQAVSKAFKYTHQNFYLVGASRTDAGVHAKGQVVRLCIPINVPPTKLLSILNNALPSDIIITEAQNADEHFHPQHAVISKKYTYTIFTRRPLPHLQRHGWFFYYPFDYEIVRKALTLYIGTYDFRMFCKENLEKNTTKTITSASIDHCRETGTYTITIEGPSFLRYMIRRIVGAVSYCAAKKNVTLEDISLALKNKKTLPLIPCAPAKGLCLEKITYGPSEKREFNE